MILLLNFYQNLNINYENFVSIKMTKSTLLLSSKSDIGERKQYERLLTSTWKWDENSKNLFNYQRWNYISPQSLVYFWRTIQTAQKANCLAASCFHLTVYVPFIVLCQIKSSAGLVFNCGSTKAIFYDKDWQSKRTNWLKQICRKIYFSLYCICNSVRKKIKYNFIKPSHIHFTLMNYKPLRFRCSLSLTRE